MLIRKFLFPLFTFPCAVIAGEPAHPYPAKSIRFVVPYTPGGSSDIQTRLIAQKLNERWDIAVIVDNRPSAGGIAACEIVANASADGYTLLLGHVGTHAFAPALYPSLPFDAARAFAPVTMTLTQPLVVVVPTTSTLSSVQMLIDAAKDPANKLNYASAGIGSPNHLAAELFKSLSRTTLAHVPYKGAVPAEFDTMAGRVDVFFDSMLSAIQMIRAKKLKPLGVTSAQRVSVLPGVPTIAESGVPGYEMQTWNGVFVPAGTPPSVVRALNTAIVEILRLPDVKAKLEGDGATLIGDTSDHFAQYVQSERTKWGDVIRRAGIRAQ